MVLASDQSVYFYDLRELEYQYAPKPLFPRAGEPVGASPRFRWRAAANADSYSIQVARDSLFTTSSIEQQAGGLIDTSYTFASEFQPGRVYYWRLRADRSDVVSWWTQPRAFTVVVGAPPPAITLTAPQTAAVGIPIPTTFSWEATPSADSYELQVTRTADFSTTVLTASPTGTSYVTALLEPGRQYIWRLRGLNALGAGPWATRSFTTVPRTPSLLIPADDASGVPGPVDFVWGDASDGATYLLHLSNSPTFDPLVYSETSTDTLASVDGLSPLRRYYWRVRARATSTIQSAWSATHSFTTSATVDGEGTPTDVPQSLVLLPVRPNPTTDALTVRFGLPRGGPVQLTMYDLLGREAARLLDSTFGPGWHEITVQAGRLELANGLYLLRLDADGEVTTSRVTVQR